MNSDLNKEAGFMQGISCEFCGSNQVTKSLKPQKFEYKDQCEKVELSVRVPVYTCASCEMEYTDDEAEKIRNDAVCAYLKVLKPDEIKQVRNQLGMTVREFSELSGLGEASIHRWENGQLIQNSANNNLILLLRDARNVSALREQKSANAFRKNPEFKFIHDRPLLEKRAEAFCLQP